MKSYLSNLRERFINLKIYYIRSVSYISLINAGLIVFLTMAKLKDMGVISIDLSQSLLYVYFGGIILMLLLGWIEVKLFKGLNVESKRLFDYTPQMVEMKAKIDYLYEKEKMK